MAITSFDSIFTYIGGFGRYQMVLFVANCYVNVLYSFVYFGQMFMTVTPPHWCSAPPSLLAHNLTEQQVKQLTLPFNNVTGQYDSCRMYDVNFTQVLEENSWVDPSWPTTTCIHGWSYNFSLYYPTITSELGWVCEEDWKPTMAQSLFFAGSVLGSPVLGWASDRWGRLPIIVFCNLVGGTAGIASAMASSLTSFSILRFIVGLTHATHYMVAYILLLEYVSTKYRTIMANVPIMLFLSGSMSIMPWIAVCLADWFSFTIVIHATQFLALSFIWLVPESARWLLSKSRVDDTIKILKKAARINRRPLSPDVIKEIEDFGWEQARREQNQASALDLLKTPVLRLRFLVLCLMWSVIVLAYDGHMRITEHIGENFFITFTVMGVVELPADFLTMLSVEKLGRRYTTVLTLAFSGVACFVVAAFPKTNMTGILGAAVAGRFLVTMAINVGQQYPVEVLPTVARGSGAGVMYTVGQVAGFLSPSIIYLSKIGHYLPYTILGVASVIGGLACIVLPETLNEILPDTLHDGETFFTNQGCCYNPCQRQATDEPEVTDVKAGSSPGNEDSTTISLMNPAKEKLPAE